MRLTKLLLAATLFAVLSASQASAQTVTGYSIYDCSASMTGSSLQLLAKNPNRKWLFIVNNGANGNAAGINLSGGTASLNGAGTITLNQNGYFFTDSNQPIYTGVVNATGTSGQEVQCYEGR